MPHELLRASLREQCRQGDIALGALTPFCRILLTTDGTLTELLEAQYLEPIFLVKLSEGRRPAPASIPALDVVPGEPIMERSILLQGQSSGKNYVFAESTIVEGGLDERVQRALVHSDRPIGRLWLDYRVEAFKEMVAVGREPAGQLAPFFALDAGAPILARTYRVFSRRRPIALITEKFPEQLALLPQPADV